MSALLAGTAGWIVLVTVWAALVGALSTRPWGEFATRPGLQTRLLLCFVALCCLRQFDTAAVRGVQLSFLGSAIATLMFGWRLALLLLAMVSAVTIASGKGFVGWSPDMLATALLPVLVAAGLLHWAQRRLPHHVMLYVLVNGFVGGALSMLASSLAKAAFVGWTGEGWLDAYLLSTPVMMFGEGFLTGGAAALMVSYRPQWLYAFDDRRYLQAPPD